MDALALGQAGLQGWRTRVADVVARPVARRTGVADDDVRAVLGATFFVLSLVHVVGTVRRWARTT